MQSTIVMLVVSWFLARLREPSTWAGIAALIAGTNVGIDAASATDALVAISSAVAGLLALVIKEKGSPKPAETVNDVGA